MTTQTRPDALDYDAADNARRCYELGLRAWREKRVRSGEIKPETPEELRQAIEGPIQSSRLDAVRK